jgi:UDP-glucose 4-epimerase
MIVLKQKETTNRRVIFLFGVGLIGTSILTKLSQSGNYEQSTHPFNWYDAKIRTQEAESIYEYVANYLRNKTAVSQDKGRATFVWSAGRAGFQDSKACLNEEMLSFNDVLDIVKRLADEFTSVSIDFHLLSSAGGLYEGQTFVDKDSIPSPQRPYGELKLRQEQSLIDLDVCISKNIYRPTSVYGIMAGSHRMGLIPALLFNGLSNKVTTIFGSFSTLRDYVHSADVAGYIVDIIHNDCVKNSHDKFILASGRPSSIFEIKCIVEKVLSKKVYLDFRAIESNSSDITFSPSVLPENWQAMDIETGIRGVYIRMVSGFLK